jgi:predicted amidohydrolase
LTANKVKVGLCQLKQSIDIADNIRKAAGMTEEAAENGASIAVLPEMFLCPYEPFHIKKAVNRSEYAIDLLKKKAQENRIYIIAGSLPFSVGGAKPFNRSFVIDPEGEEVYFHDKIHLFDCDPPGGPKVIESATVKPGNMLGAFKTPWGMCSVIVCYDIRFTQLTQLLANMGVSMMFVPAAFSMTTGPAHWEMLVRMRAMELQGFVAGVQPARNNDFKYIPYGHSIVAGPFGDVIADLGEGESLRVIEIDLNECQNLKKRFPLLEHRRSDLYRTVWLNEDSN